jgi:hypothetical protein
MTMKETIGELCALSVDAEGYDETGAYWGSLAVGEGVYQVLVFEEAGDTRREVDTKTFRFTGGLSALLVYAARQLVLDRLEVSDELQEGVAPVTGIEVSGCVEREGGNVERVPFAEAEFFTVYLRRIGGTSEALEDFTRYGNALELAGALARLLSVPARGAE